MENNMAIPQYIIRITIWSSSSASEQKNMEKNMEI